MVPDTRAWPFRALPLLLILAFAALPIVFATLPTTVAVAYAVGVVCFVAGLSVGERSLRPDELERRQRIETRRRLRQEVLRRGAGAPPEAAAPPTEPTTRTVRPLP
jgi:hypothetical protein